MAAPANCLKIFCALFDRLERKVVLDYGSGNLRNSLFMQQRGWEVYAVDLPQQIKKRSPAGMHYILPDDLAKHRLEAGMALCTFVLNLIPKVGRASVLAAIAKNIVPGGYFLLETKELSLSQLDQLVIPHGFFRVHHLWGRYTVIALYKLMDFKPADSLLNLDIIL